MLRSRPQNSPICPFCSANNFAYASFCISCGASLTENEHEDSAPVAPPSAPKSRSSRVIFTRAHWEACIGLVLLLLAVGYALLDWQRSNARSEAFNNGLTAARERDWDDALAQFERAGDYLSAELRAKEARTNVEERNRLYAEGVSAVDSRNWSVAVAAFDKLQAIQPSYGYSTQLLTQAKDQAFRVALGGIAYSVSSGPEKGLYVRDQHGRAVRIEDSDELSAIRVVSADGTRFVFDRPSSKLDFLPSLLEEGSIRSERIPVLAQVSPNGVVTMFPLPELSYDGRGIFGENGLWWYSPYSSALAGSEVYYDRRYISYSYDAPYLVRVSDLQAGRRVVGLDPTYSRVIIAEATGQPRTKERQTRLYLTGPAGERPRLLGIVEGEVQQASISALSRWLLFTSESYGEETWQSAWVLPLELRRTDAAYELESVSWASGEPTPRLTASFLPPADGQVRLAVSRIEAEVEKFAIYDLDTMSADKKTGRPIGFFRHISAYTEKPDPAATARRDRSGFSHDGWYVASRRYVDGHALLEVYGGRQGSVTQARVPLPSSGDGQFVSVQFSPRDNYIVARVRNSSDSSGGITQEIYVARTAGGGLGQARLIASARPHYDRQSPSLALPAEGSLLVYVNDRQELRAIGYDGEGDTLVTSNVRAVWSLSNYDSLYWRR